MGVERIEQGVRHTALHWLVSIDEHCVRRNCNKLRKKITDSIVQAGCSIKTPYGFNPSAIMVNTAIVAAKLEYVRLPYADMAENISLICNFGK